MNKTLKIFVIVIAVLFLTMLLVNVVWKKQLNRLEALFFQQSISQLTGVPSPDLSSSDLEQSKTTQKIFISPDGKLKIQYSSAWIEINKETLQQTGPQQYNLKHLLILQKFEASKGIAQFVISEGVTEESETLETIIDAMKETNQVQGWEMKIIDSKSENNSLDFEANYSNPGAANLHSKEKIVFLSEEEHKKFFLLAFIVPETSWLKYKQETANIFEFVEIVQ